jgi:hypothetical protein
MAQPDRFLALPESVRRFLAPPQYATISTVMPDGSPHQAVVWYALADDSLMVNSRRGRTLAGQPRARSAREHRGL